MMDIMQVLENRNNDVMLKQEQHPFVTTLVGSQNYGIATESSDIDTKTIVFPKPNDIVFNNKAIVGTVIYDNNEHNEIKDFRLWIDMLRKGGINFVEMLFSDYVYVFPNQYYNDFWKELIGNRELVAHYNIYKTAMAANGMLQKSAKSVESGAKSGFLKGKALANVMRLYYFIVKYLDGTPYSKCLKPEDADRLIEFKQGNGVTPAEADKIAKFKSQKIKHALDKLKDNGPNKEAKEFLDDYQKRTMSFYLGATFS